ncbi:hypothetical protein CR513_16166, partial [Mucuna pruriens]
MVGPCITNWLSIGGQQQITTQFIRPHEPSRDNWPSRPQVKAIRRHEEVERCHEEAMRRVGECKLELREQLDALKMIDNNTLPPQFRELMMDLFDNSQDPQIHLQAFQAQVKQLEVADLFDIKHAKSESLKQYLKHFNSAIVQVDDPNQKFFVKAFQKGLRAGSFSDSLALTKLVSIEEIRARDEKHVEAEEDKEDWLTTKKKATQGPQGKPQYQRGNNYQPDARVNHYTPLKIT